MLTAGEMAPDFEGLTASGERLKLSSLKGRSVVLYFYPKASTLGCRRESLEFARLYPEAKRRQIDIIGVSVDNVHDQRKFADECQLPFPLIADHEKIDRPGVRGPGRIRARETGHVPARSGRADQPT